MIPIIYENRQPGVLTADGTCILYKNSLADLPDDFFWKFINEHYVEQIHLHQGNKIDSYNKIVLSQLAEQKASLADFADRFSVTFDTGEAIELTKAKLRLCGDFFKGLLQNECKETKEKLIAIKELPYEGFMGILEMVEKRNLSAKRNVQSYAEAADRLLFSQPYSFIPSENIYGGAAWRAYFGNIAQTAPIPKEALEPCPCFNPTKESNGQRLIDTHLLIWMAPEVNSENLTIPLIESFAHSERFGENRLGFQYLHSGIKSDPIVNQPIEQGYWYAILKTPLEGTRGKTSAEHAVFLREHLPEGYDFATARETLVTILFQYAATNLFILGKNNNLWTYNRCKEIVDGFHVCVGAATSSGINAICSSGPYKNVCLMPVKRFSII